MSQFLMGSKSRTGHKKKRKGKGFSGVPNHEKRPSEAQTPHLSSHLVLRVSKKLVLQGERWSFVTIIQTKIYVLQIQI